MSIPGSGSISMSQIVGDIDLSTTSATANLSNIHIRNRAQKWNNPFSFSDVRGRNAHLEDAINLSWTITPSSVRTLNWSGYWAPNLGNEQSYDLSMTAAVRNGGSMHMMEQHYYQGDGDIGISGYILMYASSGIQQLTWQQYQPWPNTWDYFTRLEVTGWSGGWFSGGLQYYADGEYESGTHNAYWNGNVSYPWQCVSWHCIVKSSAIDNEYHQVDIGPTCFVSGP